MCRRGAPSTRCTFDGKIGLTYKDSTPVKPQLKVPETFGIKDAPEHSHCADRRLSVSGSAAPSVAAFRRRILTASPTTDCATIGFTPPRCAVPRERHCCVVVIIIRLAAA